MAVNGRAPRGWGAGARAIAWANVVLIAVIALATVLSYNILLRVLWSRNPWLAQKARLDFTADRRWTLSDETAELLGNLEEDVEILILGIPTDRPIPDESFPHVVQMTLDLAREFAARSERVKVIEITGEDARLAEIARIEGEINPFAIYVRVAAPEGATDPAERARYEMVPYGAIYVSGPLGQIDSFLGEAELATAIFRLTAKSKPIVYLTQGHGELTKEGPGFSYAVLAQLLETRLNGEIRELGRFDSIPPDADLVAILNPIERFDAAEISGLRAYLDRAEGKLLVTMTSDGPRELRQLLADGGIDVLEDFLWPSAMTVRDQSQAGAAIGCVPPQAGHEIVSRMRFEDPVYVAAEEPGCSPVMPKTSPEGRFYASLLLETQRPAFRRSRSALRREDPASWGVAVASERPMREQNWRIVTIGMGLFASSEWLSREMEREFLLRCIRWLLGAKGRISAPPDRSPIQRLMLEPHQRRWISWVSMAILPGAVLALGALAFALRRK